MARFLVPRLRAKGGLGHPPDVPDVLRTPQVHGEGDPGDQDMRPGQILTFVAGIWVGGCLATILWGVFQDALTRWHPDRKEEKKNGVSTGEG